MLNKYNNRVVDLVDRLMAASREYYKGSPVMSDAEYDSLEVALRREDPDNKFFELVQARTSNDKIFHPYPMLSCDKALTLDDLGEWMGGRNTDLVCTPKMDGMTVEIKLVDGVFSASTRGDGDFGEDITDRIQFISPEIYTSMRQVGGNVVIRGEAVLTKNQFVEVNKALVADGKKVLANSRNGVVGLLSSATNLPYLRFISIVMFEVLEPEFKFYSSSFDWMQTKFLGTTGLCVVPHKVFPISADVLDFCTGMTKSRDKYPVEIDGVVVRINDTQEFYVQGRTAKFWRGSVAFKFPAQGGTVIIRSIDWSVGSKEITPVANFDPIDLAGAKIGRANLHSVKNMFELGATVGSVLTLTRQGDVIPMLSRTAASTGEGDTTFEDGSQVSVDDVANQVPKNCPACGAVLSLSLDAAHLTCPNDSCQGKLGRRIEILCKSIGIEFVGQGVAEKLASVFISPIDIINIRNYVGDIAKLIGSGNLARIVQSVESVRGGVILADFIGGLSLGIGAQMVSDLFAEFGVEECMMGRVDFSSKRGIGWTQATIYKKAFEKANESIRLAKTFGVLFITPNSSQTKVSGKTVFFCVTGAVSKERRDFTKEMALRGWIFKSSVTSAVQVLICNDTSKSSTKLEDARRMGIEVISEEEARKRI